MFGDKVHSRKIRHGADFPRTGNLKFGNAAQPGILGRFPHRKRPIGRPGVRNGIFRNLLPDSRLFKRKIFLAPENETTLFRKIGNYFAVGSFHLPADIVEPHFRILASGLDAAYDRLIDLADEIFIRLAFAFRTLLLHVPELRSAMGHCLAHRNREYSAQPLNIGEKILQTSFKPGKGRRILGAHRAISRPLTVRGSAHPFTP